MRGGNTFGVGSLSAEATAGALPCSPSQPWPFRYFADPRQPIGSGNGLALAQLHGGMPLGGSFHSEVANTCPRQ